MRHRHPLAVLLALGVALVYFGSALTAGHIPSAPIHSVRGFELVHTGFDSNNVPFFGIGYARRSPYEYFTHQGETFIATRNGSLVIRRDHLEPTAFQVTEKLLRKGEGYGTKRTEILVTERSTGKVLASRELKDGQIENQTGWVGEHAILFLRKVIVPSQMRRAPLKYLGDATVHSSAEVVPVVADPGFRKVRVHGCSGNVNVSLEGTPRELKLNTPGWRFLPASPIDGVFCSSGYFVVVSSTFPSPLVVDLLTETGQHLSTTEIGVPGDLLSKGAKLAAVENGKVERGSLSFEVQYAVSTNGPAISGWVQYQRTRIRLVAPELE